jgi:hypothetical protein
VDDGRNSELQVLLEPTAIRGSVRCIVSDFGSAARDFGPIIAVTED